MDTQTQWQINKYLHKYFSVTSLGCHHSVTMFYDAADQTKIQSSFWGSLQSWPDLIVNSKYFQQQLISLPQIISIQTYLLWLVITCRSVLGCICAVTVPCSPLCWNGVWKQLNSYLHTFCHLGSASLLNFLVSELRDCVESFSIRGLILILRTLKVVFVCFSLPHSTFFKSLEKVPISHLGITYCNKICWLHVQIMELQKHSCEMML